jgi:hypothetical protein
MTHDDVIVLVTILANRPATPASHTDRTTSRRPQAREGGDGQAGGGGGGTML